MKRRGARRLLLAVFLGLFLSQYDVAVEPPSLNVGSEVFEQLADHERVRVMVMLDIPQVDRRQLGLLRAAVAGARQSALSLLGPKDFFIKRRFHTVPAFAGEITAAGVEKLRHLPGVVRIDLDVGGTGGLAQSVPLINADDVHLLGITGAGQAVAVIDTGIDSDHPDLSGDLEDEVGPPESLLIDVTESVPGSLVSWGAVAGALTYNVVRGTLSNIVDGADGYDLGTVTCLANATAGLDTAGAEDAASPAPDEVFFYLAEYDDGQPSSYGTAGALKARLVTPAQGACALP